MINGVKLKAWPSKMKRSCHRLNDIPAAGVILILIALAVFIGFITIHRTGDLGDEGLIMADVERILRGEKVYQDFFSWIPTGIYAVLACIWRIFGKQYIFVSIITAISAWLVTAAIYLASYKTVGRGGALVGAIFFAGILYPYHIVLSYHWFALLFIVLAIWFLRRFIDNHRWGEIALAGLSLGTSALFFHVRGGAAFIASLIFLIWYLTRGFDKRTAIKLILLFCLTSSVPIILFLARYFDHLKSIFDDLIVSNLYGYPHVNYIPLLNNPLFWVFLISYALILWLVVRERRSNPALLLFAIMGTVLFVSTIYRLDLVHASYAYLPVVPAAIMVIRKAWMMPKLSYLSRGLMTGLILAPIGLFIAHTPVYLYLQPDLWQPIETNIGAIHLRPSQATAKAAVLKELNQIQDQEVFIYPFSALYYPLSGKINPTKYSITLKNYLTDREFDDLIESLEKKKVSHLLFLPQETVFPFDERLQAWIHLRYQETIFSYGLKSWAPTFSIFKLDRQSP